MTPLYQSRQIGWVMIALALAMMALFALIAAFDPGSAPPLWIYPLVLAPMLMFSAMTVTVTREHVRIAFLLGVPRRTIRIADVRTCEPYRAEGLRRFATRIKPFEGQFRLGGAGGVVIVRSRGLPVTVSDPEPRKLAQAVHRALAKHSQSGKHNQTGQHARTERT